MLRFLALSLLCLPCTKVVAAGDGSDKDRQALQGTWKVVEMTLVGETPPKSAVATAAFVFEGDQWFQKTGGTVDKKGPFRVNAGKKPKTIDLLEAEGEKVLGIYQLEGDTLKICASLPLEKTAPKRPSKFSSTKENGWLLLILKRTKGR